LPTPEEGMLLLAYRNVVILAVLSTRVLYLRHSVLLLNGSVFVYSVLKACISRNSVVRFCVIEVLLIQNKNNKSKITAEY